MKSQGIKQFARKLASIEALLSVMVILSTAIIISPKTWFTQTVEFNADEYQTTLYNDSLHGNDSKAGWSEDHEGFWYCDMGDIPPNYCNASIYIADENGKGLNLSRYSEMKLWIDHIGPATTEKKHIKLYLRNAGKKYFKPDDNFSAKFNQIQISFDDLRAPAPITLEMEAFNVADWWLALRSMDLSKTEFDNITIIELQASEGDFTHEDLLHLNKIQWQGKLFSDESIYKSLVIAWSTLIFILLFYRLIKLKLKLAREKKHQMELIEINSLLQLKNLEFSDLAKIDHLTGLYNRLGIHDALYENIKIWKDNRTPFSLILLDIDNFKNFNDSYGHDAGDSVLKSLSDLLCKNTRSSDCVARWGGEEFAILCSNTDLYRAHLIAETLREKIEAACIHADTQVTASFGVASAIQPDVNDLFKRADTALYEAKKQGRNRTCVNSDFLVSTND
ncbi:diguanylate cyclase (GGDEF) domain-containing protein [Alteromonadaceae bacterium Bs31]|nr:diguanylate cyclase (GGDEF) domain-containing protein [Alteromonadaceae bacterium Bs31]